MTGSRAEAKGQGEELLGVRACCSEGHRPGLLPPRPGLTPVPPGAGQGRPRPCCPPPPTEKHRPWAAAPSPAGTAAGFPHALPLSTVMSVKSLSVLRGPEATWG